MGNIIGEPLDDYVANQIKARQKLHGSGVRFDQNTRTEDQLNILNSNTSWIKLASGVSISDEERLKDLGFTSTERPNLLKRGLAQKYVLFNGISEYNEGVLTQRQGFKPSTFQNVFNDNGKVIGATIRDSEDSSYIYSRYRNAGSETHGSDSGYSPMPGIISMEVKALKRGSIEKAFVKIKAQNRQQLDILDTLYMRLGYTVLLEWGNTLYTTSGGDKQVVRNTIIEDKFFEFEGNRSYLDFIGGSNDPLIKSYKEKYNGNYDGMLAVISNFSWTFNNDGSYDIDLTLISLGDVIESLKSNISINSKVSEFISSNTLASGSIENPIIETSKDLNNISSMLWLFTRFGPTKKEINIFLPGMKENVGKRTVGYFLNKGKVELVNQTGVYTFYEKTSTSKEYLPLTPQTYTTINPDQNAEQYLINRFHTIGNNKYATVGPSSDPTKGYVLSGNGKKRMLTYYIPYTVTAYVDNSVPGSGLAGVGAGATEQEFTRYHKYIIYYTRKPLKSNESISNPIAAAPGFTAFQLDSTEKQYYLRFAYLLEFIQENIIPEISSSPDNAPLFSIDYDTWSNYMYSLPNQISLDPTKCIVRNDHFVKLYGEKNPSKSFPELQPFRIVDTNADNNFAKNQNLAYPLNIYLNFNFILESLKSNQNERGDTNLYGFISSICTGLNKALGGVNNLEPIINKDTNTLTIIDSTPIPGVSCPEDSSYELMLYGYKGSNLNPDKQSFTTYESNFIRDINLKTTISPDYATMVTVGATANGYVKGTEATAFSVWNEGIVDRFKNELIPPPQQVESDPTDYQKEALTNYGKEFLYPLTHCYGFDGNLYPSPPSVGNLNSDIIGKNISIVTEFYKYIIAKKGQKTQQAGTIGFIPFKLSITMDGISGIKIYNKLNVNSSFLPVRYGKTLNFIITGVNHRLQNNDWETTLETIVMPKTSQLEISDYDISSIAQDISLSEASIPSSAIPTVLTSGNGLDPIKNLIAKLESFGGDYNAYNWANGKFSRSSTENSPIYSPKAITLTNTKISTLTAPYKGPGTDGIKINAMGKYQTIVSTLRAAAKYAGISNELYSKQNQEIVIEYLLLYTPIRPSLTSYLKGKNKGTIEDLTRAVQDIAQTWSSFPTVFLRDKKTKVGYIAKGGGNITYNFGKGINPRKSKIKIADVVQALITSRIQYTGVDSLDLYKPSYYNPTYVFSKVPN